MSGNLSQSGSDLYAVVDLSKKKKIKSSGVTDSQRSEPDISMYAVVERGSPLLSQKEEQKYNNQRNNPSCKQNLDSGGTNGSNLTPSRLKQSIYIMLAIAAFVVFVVVIAMIIMIFIKLAALEAANSSYNGYLKSNLSSLQTSKEDVTNEVDQINKTLQEFFQNELKIIQQTIDTFETDLQNALSFEGRLDHLNDSYESLASEVNDLSSSLNTTHEVQRNSLGELKYYPPSCSAILQQNLYNPTGNYIVRSSTDLLRSVYCDMTRTCGGITGGWMRVAELDLNHCPHGLKSMLFDIGGTIQTCVVNNDTAGCISIQYSTFDVQYTKVCGKIRAYQVGTPDGFTSVTSNPRTMNINDNYLDGISITSNQQHVWSFAAGDCDCNNSPPPFIDGDWACGEVEGCQKTTLCTPLLWSSQTCGEEMSPYFF